MNGVNAGGRNGSLDLEFRILKTKVVGLTLGPEPSVQRAQAVFYDEAIQEEKFAEKAVLSFRSEKQFLFQQIREALKLQSEGINCGSLLDDDPFGHGDREVVKLTVKGRLCRRNLEQTVLALFNEASFDKRQFRYLGGDHRARVF